MTQAAEATEFALEVLDPPGIRGGHDLQGDRAAADPVISDPCDHTKRALTENPVERIAGISFKNDI